MSSNKKYAGALTYNVFLWAEIWKFVVFFRQNIVLSSSPHVWRSSTSKGFSMVSTIQRFRSPALNQNMSLRASVDPSWRSFMQLMFDAHSLHAKNLTTHHGLYTMQATLPVVYRFRGQTAPREHTCAGWCRFPCRCSAPISDRNYARVCQALPWLTLHVQ